MRHGLRSTVVSVVGWIAVALLRVIVVAAVLAFYAGFFWYVSAVPRGIVVDLWQTIPANWHGEAWLALGVVAAALVVYLVAAAVHDVRTGGWAATHQAYEYRPRTTEFEFADSGPGMDLDVADLG